MQNAMDAKDGVMTGGAGPVMGEDSLLSQEYLNQTGNKDKEGNRIPRNSQGVQKVYYYTILILSA